MGWGAASRKIRWEKKKWMDGLQSESSVGGVGDVLQVVIVVVVFLWCCYEESGGPSLGPTNPPNHLTPPPHEISRNYFLTQAACSSGAAASLRLPLGRSWK